MIHAFESTLELEEINIQGNLGLEKLRKEARKMAIQDLKKEFPRLQIR